MTGKTGKRPTPNVQRPTSNSECFREQASKPEKSDRKLHRRKREQGWKYELLHTRAGWLYPIDSQGSGRRAAAGTGRRARRVARDRTALRRCIVGNASRSRVDCNHVVARSETRCAERTSAQRSESS